MKRIFTFIILILLLQISLAEAYITIGEKAEYKFTYFIKIENQGPEAITELDISMPLLVNNPPYQEVSDPKFNVDCLESLELDENQNSIAHFHIESLAPYKDFIISATYDITINEITFDLTDAEEQPESSYYTPKDFTYLTAERFIESDDNKIQTKMKEIVGRTNNLYLRIKRIYDYIIENFKYDTYHSEDKGALWILSKEKGDCTEFSYLLVALSRAAGIPSRTIDGYVYKASEQNHRDSFHTWTECFIPPLGWIPIDPTYAQSGTNYFGYLDNSHIWLTHGTFIKTAKHYHYFYCQYYPGKSKVETIDWIEIEKK